MKKDKDEQQDNAQEETQAAEATDETQESQGKAPGAGFGAVSR